MSPLPGRPGTGSAFVLPEEALMTRALLTRHELEQRISALTAVARTTTDADERLLALAERDRLLEQIQHEAEQ